VARSVRSRRYYLATRDCLLMRSETMVLAELTLSTNPSRAEWIGQVG